MVSKIDLNILLEDIMVFKEIPKLGKVKKKQKKHVFYIFMKKEDNQDKSLFFLFDSAF